MATVALIGADGSGKTTVANCVIKNPPVKLKYIYMGLNIESSNYTLPTSKLIYYLKLRKYKKKHNLKGSLKGKNISIHTLDDNRTEDTRGMVGATFRMLNRLSEQIYRQFIALIFQFRGYTVLYDRHFLFDGSIADNPDKKKYRLSSRFYNWMLNNMLGKPNVVIFLYAPAEVLHARKKETTLQYLKDKNESLEKIGNRSKHFIKVDATKPLNEVVEIVNDTIKKFNTPVHYREQNA